MGIVRGRSCVEVVAVCAMSIVLMSAAGYAEESNTRTRDESTSGDAALVRVEAKYVCMPNNKRFEKEQIPIEIDNKTYYGCCKMCVNMLKLDPDTRSAVDPVSGRQVDKAVAVIGAAPDKTVYYFENEKNLRKYKPKSDDGELPRTMSSAHCQEIEFPCRDPADLNGA